MAAAVLLAGCGRQIADDASDWPVHAPKDILILNLTQSNLLLQCRIPQGQMLSYFASTNRGRDVDVWGTVTNSTSNALFRVPIRGLRPGVDYELQLTAEIPGYGSIPRFANFSTLPLPGH